jgi:4-hydroxy-tetrahydrodipicolinate synthase
MMNKELIIPGIIPALITSFDASGNLDMEGIKTNVEFLIEKGISGLLICGSTGEAATLTREERRKVIEHVVKVTNKRIKVIVGTGAPATAETINNSLEAKAAGADAILAITPFYIIPTQDGIYNHYKQINDIVGLPLYIYNLPQHTGVDISLDLLERLADLEHIVGIKESSGRASYIAEAIFRVGSKIAIIEGGDDVVFPSLCMGATANIVALGNLAPAELVNIYNSVKSGDIATAKKIYFQILPIARAISVSINFPAGVKAGVELLGRPAGPCRSPISILPEEREMIRKALVDSKLL